MERSLVKTLARKYRATSGQAYRRDRPCWPLSTGPAAGCGSPCTATARSLWSRNRAGSAWRGMPRQHPSTTIPRASGAAGQN
jgi:hypothetical protein